MSRPEEPTEALPTRAVPAQADPGATVDLDRTRPLDRAGHADPDRTVHLAAADATAYLGSTDATVHLGSPDATVRFGVGPTGASAPTAPTAAAPATEAYQQGPSPTGTPEPATARPAGEIRFGPGVPATPPAAPAWPAVAPARRSRPMWRRIVSILSTLLTVALLAVVGVYLWQRISPLEIEGVTVAVPRPAGDRCDVTVDVVATVRTNGRGGVLRYQWFRSDAAPGSLLSERVGRGQRTVILTLKWTFSGVGATRETATVNIIEPSPVQAGTDVVYRCRRS
ncbi:MAG: hypothetical protein WA890_11155 [Micromonospora sp.]